MGNSSLPLTCRCMILFCFHQNPIILVFISATTGAAENSCPVTWSGYSIQYRVHQSSQGKSCKMILQKRADAVFFPDIGKQFLQDKSGIERGLGPLPL